MQVQVPRRNVIADALRGVAGLLVPLFHLSEPYGWNRAGASGVPQICGHGYLCVEFFLLLMGYMLAYAYDRRWKEGMGIGAFFKRRLLRLHPLIVSGTVIGLIVFFAQGLGCPLWDKALKAFGPWEFAGLVVAGLLFLPYPGSGFLVPFNPCAWTLAYEYLANILYALFVRRLGRVALAVLSVIAGLWTMSFVLHIDLNALFGTSSAFLAEIAARKGDSIEIGLQRSPRGRGIRSRSGGVCGRTISTARACGCSFRSSSGCSLRGRDGRFGSRAGDCRSAWACSCSCSSRRCRSGACTRTARSSWWR